MKPADLAASYDQIADRWKRLEQSDNGIPQHERAIAFVDRRRYALDVGCGGSGRFVSLLLRHSFHVEGVDISEQMITLARKRHPDVRFYRADVCAWELPRQYDLISACVCRHLEYDQHPELHLYLIAQRV